MTESFWEALSEPSEPLSVDCAASATAPACSPLDRAPRMYRSQPIGGLAKFPEAPDP